MWLRISFMKAKMQYGIFDLVTAENICRLAKYPQVILYILAKKYPARKVKHPSRIGYFMAKPIC